MLQSLLSELPDAIIMGLSPQLVVAIVIGVLLVAAIAYAFSKLGSTAGAYSWQLGLLMATGVALSIASGWTTWDGMKNFTREPVLALLITFGIQSVLLVVSWLIGESFANRPRLTIASEVANQGAEEGFLWSVISFAGTGAGAVALVLFVDDVLNLGMLGGLPEGIRSMLLTISVGCLVFTLIAALCLTGGGILFRRTIGLLRVVAQNATLWVMLVACFGASVFFSFDSLFSTIFPQDERARASDIRTRGQIAEIINDAKARALTRQLELQAAFSNSGQWADYAKRLDDMVESAARLPTELEANARERFRRAQGAISALEVDLAAAEARLKSLTTRGEGLRAEAVRIRGAVDNAEVARRNTRDEILRLEQKIAANAVETEKELKGLGVGPRPGRGPVYKSLERAGKNLEFELRLAMQRVAQLEKQSAESQPKLVTTEAAVAEIDQEIAKQSVKVETARALVDAAAQKPVDISSSGSITLVAEQLHQLEQSRIAVLRVYSAAALDRVEATCLALAETFASVPRRGAGDWQHSCATNELRAAAADVFQVSLALSKFDDQCAAADSLPNAGGTDELIGFARRCIQMSGLPSNDIASLHEGIGSIALNRDDKAHRFVVTLNAFGDGNRLAYLALAIAIAIDGLVFASGIFYAQAARSPLSDIPGTVGRPQRELAHILDSALLPNAPRSAAGALEAIRPLMRAGNDKRVPGFTHEIDMSTLKPSVRPTILKILGAGAAIGAVSRLTDDPDRYLVRGEVVTYLSRHAYMWNGEQLQFEGETALSELLSGVLADEVGAGAATVLNYFEPMPRRDDFATRVVLSEIEDESDARIVRRVLNAAAVLGYVRVTDEASAAKQFLLHRDVFFALTDLATRGTLPTGANLSSIPETIVTDEVERLDTSANFTGETVTATSRIEPLAAPQPLLDAQQVDATSARMNVMRAQNSGLSKSAIGAGGSQAPKASSGEVAVHSGAVTAMAPATGGSAYGSTKPVEAGADLNQEARKSSDEKKRCSLDIALCSSVIQACESQEANGGPAVLDFGMDLSEAEFPESLFESLQDEPAYPEEAEMDVGRKLRVHPTRVAGE